MNRLTNRSGGMPLQLEDFRYIHDNYQGAFNAVIEGLRGVPCIISGLQVTTGTNIEVSEGYYWDGAEIFYVPAFSTTYHAGYIPCIIRNDDTSEAREFYNGSTFDCYESRQYEVVYDDEVPTGGVPILTSERLEEIIDEQTRDVVNTANQFSDSISVAYESSYTKIGTYNGVHVSGNNFGDIMIIAAFTTSTANGKICTLPSAYRPPSDVIGSFFAGTNLGGLLIKSNGEVWVIGASTTDDNYITFQFNKGFTNNVNYSIDLSGLPD